MWLREDHSRATSPPNLRIQASLGRSVGKTWSPLLWQLTSVFTEPDVMEHLQTSGQPHAACVIHNMITINPLRNCMTPLEWKVFQRKSQSAFLYPFNVVLMDMFLYINTKIVHILKNVYPQRINFNFLQYNEMNNKWIFGRWLFQMTVCSLHFSALIENLYPCS